jgi:hypothetical protein
MQTTFISPIPKPAKGFKYHISNWSGIETVNFFHLQVSEKKQYNNLDNNQDTRT